MKSVPQELKLREKIENKNLQNGKMIQEIFFFKVVDVTRQFFVCKNNIASVLYLDLDFHFPQTLEIEKVNN